MAQVKFYRGADGVSLPEYSEGAIFVIGNNNILEDGTYYGDVYVDIMNGKRLHILPDSGVYYKTREEIASSSMIPSLGRVYVIYNYQVSIDDDNNITYIPAVVVGDGTRALKDLPVAFTATADQIDFWNNKVTAYMDPEQLETLVLSKE